MTARDIIMSAAGNSGDSKTYIEDVFSTYLYTGTNTTFNVVNGIDLAGKGGMVWIKSRSNATNNMLFSTPSVSLTSNTTSAADERPGYNLYQFNNDGFGLSDDYGGNTNVNGYTYASWTFRKAPKFFDVVTYTGDGVSGRQISHSLGQEPGMIIVKRTDATSPWYVYHRSLPVDGTTPYVVYLNQTNAQGVSGPFRVPSASTFTLRSESLVNASGATYVAYLFAHDTTTDGLIQCGSFTTDASGNATVNLGWEPQWLLAKRSDSSTVGNWLVEDTMRSFQLNGRATLFANLSNAEAVSTLAFYTPNATGFSAINNSLAANASYIYMAIRRGPMKTPTDGTKVFSPNTTSNDNNPVTTGFPVDMFIEGNRGGSNVFAYDRLRGGGNYLLTNLTDAESGTYWVQFQSNTSYTPQTYGNASAVGWSFRRAPGFFDEVCYTGTGAASTTVTHNLGVAPEMIIIKARAGASDNNWYVYQKDILTTDANGILSLNRTLASTSFNGEYVFGNNTNIVQPTSTLFTVGAGVNDSGQTSVGYLFASCPGVSKVGSYTGTGSTQTISCGFTGGARFVLIKRTDSTGDWYVWDTARGMVSGTDPSLLLNSTAAEVNANSVYTTTSGFQIVSTAAGINASGGAYIYLAIA